MVARRIRVPIPLLGAVLGCAVAGSRPGTDNESAFRRAESAFMQHRIDDAAAAYEEVIARDSIPEHRVRAFQSLASIAWRIHRDTVAALGFIRQMEQMPEGAIGAAGQLVRMRMEARDYPGARDAALVGRSRARTPLERDQATTGAALAVVTAAMDERLGAPRTTMIRATRAHGDSLRAITDELRAVVARLPGEQEPAALLVLAGALVGDGRAMLAGWRSYYLVQSGDRETGLLATPRRTLERTLTRWRRASSFATRRVVVYALADSRFFDAAALIAVDSTAGATPIAGRDARARDIVRYVAYLRDTRRLTDEYYRMTALGPGDPLAWRRAVDAASAALWSELSWAPAAPTFDTLAFRAELGRRFGAVIAFGPTAGTSDLHFGHRVVDVTRMVRQYGESAAVHFVILDAMASNGFQSWAWDGRSAHGGWADSTMIVQVRPAYVEGPLSTWREMHDAGGQARRDREIAADSIADLARAAQISVAFFPSVADRMRRDGLKQLLDSLASRGMRGATLESAFKRAYGDAMLESSIFAHEGRHAIDARMRIVGTSADREFRAKLSEVAFAPLPRLAVDPIIAASIGDSTPHGLANARIMQGLVAWMGSHRAETHGLAAGAPLLPQLPLLTDAQLRQAFASMDPLRK